MKSCFLACSIILLSACTSKKNGSKNAAPGQGSASTSVETQKPNTDYKPAFAGQTRIKAATTSTPYTVTILSEALDNPWDIEPLPDGRFIITQKNGTLRIADGAGTVSEAITGLPAVKLAGQGGLLGIAVAPDFSESRMLYWTFAQEITGGTVTAVAKGRLSKDEKTVENAAVIYQALPAFNSNLHYGGRIVFDKSGNLYVSTGERSDKESRPQAQQLNSALGKIVYIDKDGNPLSTNPFYNDPAAKKEIYTYGHRNTQGLAFHPVTGDLWNNEFGPRGGDEVNLVVKGKNYGWPVITYGLEYGGQTIGEGITQKEGMEQPVYYWDPVVSPSGMTFYSSGTIPEWKNNLFIGCLSGSHILRLIIENNKVVGEERLLATEGQRFRDVTEGKDGALYAVCDGRNGRLYKISKK